MDPLIWLSEFYPHYVDELIGTINELISNPLWNLFTYSYYLKYKLKGKSHDA